MATPPIGKLSSAAFPVVGFPPRVRSAEARARPEGGAPPGDPSLELLEVAAGQVAESTGEPCTAAPAAVAGADPSYRMELMGFIVGSLSRAAQTARGSAPQPAESEATDEEDKDAAAEVEAALPEAALPMDPLVEPPAQDGEPEPEVPAGYGQDGHAREGGKPEGRLTRWV